MIVTLFVNGKAVESRPIPDKNFLIAGYYEGLKKDMLEAQGDIMDLSGKKTEFTITGFDPPMKIVKN